MPLERVDPESSRPVSFSQVHGEEIAHIARLRADARVADACAEDGRRAAPSSDVAPDADAIEATRDTLFGLAFSGGGIRSATFNLGILQGMAECDLLRKVDYLSTVSGGGYIGGWLQALIQHQVSRSPDGRLEPAKLQTLLSARGRQRRGAEASAGGQALDSSHRMEQPEIRFLRDHSNYLTPKMGLFTTDTWTVAAIYLRNLLLNLTVLLPALAAVMLICCAIVDTHKFLMGAENRGHVYIDSALCVTTSVVAALWLLTRDSRLGTRRLVYALVVGPLLLGSWLLSTFALDPTWYHAAPTWLLAIPFIYAALWGSVWTSSQEGDVRPLEAGAAAFGGAVLAGALLYATAQLPWSDSEPSFRAAFGTSAVLLAIGLAIGFQVGFLGRRLGEHIREWGSRLVALLWVCSLAVGALFALAAFGNSVVSSSLDSWSGGVAASLWSSITVGGLVAGRSSETTPGWVIGLLKRVAPYVFVFGLLVLVSALCRTEVVTDLLSTNAALSQLPPRLAMPALAAGLLFLSWLLSERVGVNEFSIHALYRNRLVRCYLGAARGNDRDADDFVGFDRKDDALRMDELSVADRSRPVVRPYHIVNATLNLVAGERLAWQFRRARPFIFTPLYSGYDARSESGSDSASASTDSAVAPKSGLWDEGYRPTRKYGGGISLGTAMAISGAAVAPNMGARTSPALAFLMTVFNIRLGWWLGNPRHLHTWNQAGPSFGLVSLLVELLGSVSDRRRYVYLSDGGHFENLGIYELVRRKCRYIIASDAGADPDMSFEDLAGAIEKCRADFGVDITIDLSSFRYDASKNLAATSCAVGRIRYDPDAPERDGTLVYVKACLTGCEPADVQGYARGRRAFPHESTTDQWFDEAQFESYRALGQHVARNAFAAVKRDPNSASTSELDLERTFVLLEQEWTARSPYHEHAFTKHAEELSRLYEIMRNTPSLAFLVGQMCPEWRSLLTQATAQTDSARTVQELAGKHRYLPTTEDELRAGFYFCHQLIQLMENVYIDLRLERTFDHLDNRGWINLFRNWSWSSMFRVTWVTVGPTTGARFQTFVERHLEVGRRGALPTQIDRPPKSQVALKWSEHGDAAVRARKLGLSSLEEKLLGKILHATGTQAKPRVFAAAIRVPDVLQQRESEGGGDIDLAMAFGVVLGSKLLYLRVRDHLRRSGFAREILRNLVRLEGVDGVEEGPHPELEPLLTPDRSRRLQRLLASVKREFRQSPVCENEAANLAPGVDEPALSPRKSFALSLRGSWKGPPLFSLFRKRRREGEENGDSQDRPPPPHSS